MSIRQFRLKVPGSDRVKKIQVEDRVTPAEILRKVGLDPRDSVLADRNNIPLDKNAPIGDQVTSGSDLLIAPSMDVG